MKKYTHLSASNRDIIANELAKGSSKRKKLQNEYNLNLRMPILKRFLKNQIMLLIINTLVIGS